MGRFLFELLLDQFLFVVVLKDVQYEVDGGLMINEVNQRKFNGEEVVFYMMVLDMLEVENFVVLGECK